MQLTNIGLAGAHPAWCSIAHCDYLAGNADVRHTSAPQVWRATADDIQIEAAVHRDDYEGGLEVHGVTLRLRVDGTEEFADVLLAEEDVTRLEGVFALYREITAGRG